MTSTDRKLELKANASMAQTASQVAVYVKGLKGENIVKQNSIMGQSIHPAERLVICSKFKIIYNFIGTYCVQYLSDFRSGLLLRCY
jgi:hypothetical protein